MHFNIIFSVAGSAKWSPFLTKTLYALVLPICNTWPTHFILPDLTTRLFGEEYTSYLVPFRTNILLSNLFSNSLSLRLRLNVSNQVSHPYKTTGKIIVLWKRNYSVLGLPTVCAVCYFWQIVCTLIDWHYWRSISQSVLFLSPSTCTS